MMDIAFKDRLNVDKSIVRFEYGDVVPSKLRYGYFRRVLMCMFCAVLLVGDAAAGIWFKGEAAIKDTISNIEKHRFYIKWMVKARGAEDAMIVQMTIQPNSPVFGKEHQYRSVPMELMFDMLDDKGNSLGETKFIVPPESWRWDRYYMRDYLRKWDRNFRYDDWDETYRKMIIAYFHGFFTPPKECVTLFLKTVRTCEEDVYYDLGNTGPKIVSNRLRSSIDKRSVRCTIEVNTLGSKSTEVVPSQKEEESREEEKFERRSNADDEVKNVMSENIRNLQEQIREQKAKMNEDKFEMEKLKRQNEQMKSSYDRLKEGREAELASMKERLNSLNQDLAKLQHVERLYSESAERMRALDEELGTLKQNNQSLLEKMNTYKSRQSWYIVTIVVLGLLVVIGIIKLIG